MDLAAAILAVLLLLAVVFVISGPLRATPSTSPPPAAERDELERDALEAAREAKYREIRDAELDFRTGKLSREDHEAIDRALRAEALEILDRLERSTAAGRDEDGPRSGAG